MELEITGLLSKLNQGLAETEAANGSVPNLPSPLPASLDLANTLTVTRVTALEAFNKKSENTFKFGPVKLEVKKNLIETLYELLQVSCNALKSGASDQSRSDSSSVENHTKLICACLDTVRLLSRDTDGIEVFEHGDLLSLIQSIANLAFEESILTDQTDISRLQAPVGFLNQEVIVVAGLKSISNLIYNSKCVQEFYAQKGVAESITIHLKQFSPESIRDTNINQNQINIMIFNLRILFLLTIFNKELRVKLKDKLQVITYLTEIIDQIMKERLNPDGTRSGENTQAEPDDYCYLKRTDIDCVNEILKILYNVTLDMPSVKANAVSTMTSKPAPIKFDNDILEEDEAHLMRLGSVLRDLMACKLEAELADPNNLAHLSKIDDMHSNIINLLTNMPSICFEELMTPCLNTLTGSPLTDEEHLLKMTKSSTKYASSDNASFRMAHNRKRLSRRSKRAKKQPSSPTFSASDASEQSTSSLGSRPASSKTPDSIIGCDEDFEFEGKNMEAIGMILSFMSRGVNIYLKKPAGYNADQLYPVLLLLSLMSKANATIRRYCRLKVLPPLGEEVLKLPQQGCTLRNRLATLMTDANIQVKRLSAQFLFILCKESVGRLVKYTGYGNAAGLLAEAGLMVSKHGDRAAYSSDSDDSDTEEYKKHEEHVNPITGRAEPNAEAIKREIIDSMTDEQKEYEALEIVKTIDKLTRMGAGGIKPATIGPDGKLMQLEHVLQLQDGNPLSKIGKKSEDDEDKNP